MTHVSTKLGYLQLAQVVAASAAIAGAIGSAFPSLLASQTPQSRQDQIVRVLTMYDATSHWLPFESARLAVQEYGSDAGVVAQSILDQPQTSRHPWRRVLAALGVAAYERSEFPVGRLEELASGRVVVHPNANVNFNFQLEALRSLSARPRPELVVYWKARLEDLHAEVRRIAAAGVACAEGPASHLVLTDVWRSDPDSSVRQVANFYVRQIAEAGDSARLCLYGTWTRARAMSDQIPRDSSLVRKAKELFGFRGQ